MDGVAFLLMKVYCRERLIFLEVVMNKNVFAVVKTALVGRAGAIKEHLRKTSANEPLTETSPHKSYRAGLLPKQKK